MIPEMTVRTFNNHERNSEDLSSDLETCKNFTQRAIVIYYIRLFAQNSRLSV